MGRPKGSKNKTRRPRAGNNKNKDLSQAALISSNKASTPERVNIVKAVGQTILDLRAFRTILDRTRTRGITPIFYEPLYCLVNNGMRRLGSILTVGPKKVDVWIMRLDGGPHGLNDLIIGATEQACWEQLKLQVVDDWELVMVHEPMPKDPDEAVNEFLEHSGISVECEQNPLPFLTSLPEPKKVDP